MGKNLHTFPSPSASVEPAHHSRCSRHGFFHTFPEPEAEGDPPPATSSARSGERNVKRSSIYSGSPAKRRPMKRLYDGRRHSRFRASPMGARSCSASGSSAQSSRSRPCLTRRRYTEAVRCVPRPASGRRAIRLTAGDHRCHHAQQPPRDGGDGLFLPAPLGQALEDVPPTQVPSNQLPGGLVQGPAHHP